MKLSQIMKNRYLKLGIFILVVISMFQIGTRPAMSTTCQGGVKCMIYDYNKLACVAGTYQVLSECTYINSIGACDAPTTRCNNHPNCYISDSCSIECLTTSCTKTSGTSCYVSSGSCVYTGTDNCGSTCWDYCSVSDAGCSDQNCPTNCGYGGGYVNNGSFSSGCTCATKYCSPVTCDSCTITVTGATVDVGQTATLTANATPTGGTISKVDFTSGSTTVATLNPGSDSASPYSTVATGVASGTSTITAKATMDTGATCTGTSTVTVPPPSCTVSFNFPNYSVGIGGSATAGINLTFKNGTVSSVNYSSSNAGIATVNPTSVATSPYLTTITGVQNGTATINANVVMAGLTRCSASATVLVFNPPWWKVIDADVLTNGVLNVVLPQNQYFNLAGAGGSPGVTVYGDSTSLTNQTVSQTGWLANSATSTAKVYGSVYFLNILENSTQVINDVPVASLTQYMVDTTLPAAGSDGYVYFLYDSAKLGRIPLNIDALSLGDKKIIMLVKGAADVNINGTINRTLGKGFFMVVTPGNINVAPAVGGGTLTPDLEGIYIADGSFKTGTGTTRLWVKGTVVSYNTLHLQRDLGSGNGTTEGSLFEYAPDLEFLFPAMFSTHNTVWREVAP